VLAVEKVLYGSGRAGRLRLTGKYISHRLVARPELDNNFWTDSTGRVVDSLSKQRGKLEKYKQNIAIIEY